MSQFMLYPLIEATWQTIYMVFLSSFVSIFIGLSLGVILYLTRQDGLQPQVWVNRILGVIVNITRSVPFIIFMIAIIPFTRWLVGSSIGINAAIVPLTLAAIPFYARIAEAAVSEVSEGLVEAALSMGASTWIVVRRVYIPEALPALLNGATLTVISLIGYSAMAGVVGGGGLGELAIEYGYQRFIPEVMLETVVVLVVIVQLIQSGGDWLAKSRKVIWLVGLCVVLWGASIAYIMHGLFPQQAVLKVGIVGGPMQQIMQVAKQEAKAEGFDLDLVVFQDYVLPNTALNNGNIDANIFQHQPYLNAQVKARGYKLVSIAKTFVFPMGLYSSKFHSLQALPHDALVAIPNDPSNEGRALLLCQKAGLIKLRRGSGLFATPNDIVSNPKQLRFRTIDAAQVPRVLPDVDLAAITNDYAPAAGLTVNDALFKEGADAPYANIIVVRKGEHNPLLLKLIAIMHSKAVVQETLKLFPDGAAIPAWHQD